MLSKIGKSVWLGGFVLVLSLSLFGFSGEPLRVYEAGGTSVIFIDNTTDRIVDYVTVKFDQAVTLDHIMVIGGGEVLKLTDILADVNIHDVSQAGTYWGIALQEGSGIVPGGTLQIYVEPADATVTYYCVN